jgi:hypothetical protein
MRLVNGVMSWVLLRPPPFSLITNVLYIDANMRRCF